MAAVIRFDVDISKMTKQAGYCTTVVVQNETQTHQQNTEIGLPLYMQLFPCRKSLIHSCAIPQFLEAESLLHVFFSSHFFYFYFGIVKV